MQEGLIGPATTYTVCMTLEVPPKHQQGWRTNANDAYHGGWVLDVGVHAVRALRMWFGEVQSVCCEEWCNMQEVLSSKSYFWMIVLLDMFLCFTVFMARFFVAGHLPCLYSCCLNLTILSRRERNRFAKF
jgi:hypothetical protein